MPERVDGLDGFDGQEADPADALTTEGAAGQASPEVDGGKEHDDPNDRDALDDLDAPVPESS